MIKGKNYKNKHLKNEKSYDYCLIIQIFFVYLQYNYKLQ